MALMHRARHHLIGHRIHRCQSRYKEVRAAHISVPVYPAVPDIDTRPLVNFTSVVVGSDP